MPPVELDTPGTEAQRDLAVAAPKPEGEARPPSEVFGHVLTCFRLTPFPESVRVTLGLGGIKDRVNETVVEFELRRGPGPSTLLDGGYVLLPNGLQRLRLGAEVLLVAYTYTADGSPPPSIFVHFPASLMAGFRESLAYLTDLTRSGKVGT